MNKLTQARAKKWAQTLIKREHSVRNWHHIEAQDFLTRAWLAGARALDRWHRGPFSEVARLRSANGDLRRGILHAQAQIDRLNKVDKAAKLVIASMDRKAVHTDDQYATWALDELRKAEALRVVYP